MRQLFWLWLAVCGGALFGWASGHLDKSTRRLIGDKIHAAAQRDPELRAALISWLRP